MAAGLSPFFEAAPAWVAPMQVEVCSGPQAQKVRSLAPKQGALAHLGCHVAIQAAMARTVKTSFRRSSSRRSGVGNANGLAGIASRIGKNRLDLNHAALLLLGRGHPQHFIRIRESHLDVLACRIEQGEHALLYG
ncbi:MAG: hypothetical protein RhofKO_11940 [Rhodothermales bacterium]